MKSRSHFELAVGSLVLDCIEPAGQKAFSRAFTSEFETLVRAKGFPDMHTATADWRLPVLSISASAEDPPARLGKALARGLFSALKREAGDA